MADRRRPSAAARALLTLALLGAAAEARAELTGLFEPTYANSQTETRDATGVSHTSINSWLQRYRFNWDQAFYPQLKLNAGGTLDWTLGSTTTEGARTDQDLKQWTVFAHLMAGGPVLSAGLNYDRTENDSRLTSAGVRLSSPSLVREALTASLGWRPADLPSLDLRLSRTFAYDKQRTLSDLRTDEVNVASVYRPTRQLDTSYNLRFTDADDRVHQLDQRDLVNAARVAWSDRLLDGRLTGYASYSLANRLGWTDLRGAGGTVTTQQFPTAGLALVEAFPATPDKDTLGPSPALVDGDVTLSTGISIGFNPSLAGDRNFRDLGAQFGGALATVNAVYVYVDRQLPANVAAGYVWTAWRSDDNVAWTPVPLAGAVQFGTFQNRFEIPIAQTDGARFLKVVTQPLLTAVTTDRQFADILVTELQFVLVQPAAQVQRHQSVTSGQLSANARYLIARSWNLAYDTAFFLSHTTNPARRAWSLLNGLSMSQRLSRVLGLNARVDRTESDQGQGHEAVSRASVSLSADPLPTLGGAVSYTSQVSQLRRGTGYSNGLTLFARADLYEGLAVSSNASYVLGHNELGQSTTNRAFAASLSATPNRVVTLAGTCGLSEGTLSGGGLPDHTDHSSQLTGTVTVTPFPALFFSAGVSRLATGSAATTLLNLAGSFSPFPRGDLLMRFSYNESLDTAADTRLRQWGPGLRWNIRRGWYFDLSYTLSNTRTPAVETDSRTLFADLVITYR